MASIIYQLLSDTASLPDPRFAHGKRRIAHSIWTLEYLDPQRFRGLNRHERAASLSEIRALLRTSERDLDMQKAGKPPPSPKPPKQPKPKKDDRQSSLF